MKADEPILSLVKIGPEKYQKRLFEKGEIFMNTIRHFRELEDTDGRGDKYEGAEKIDQLNWIKFKNKDSQIELSIEAGNLKQANLLTKDEDLNCNIYSMVGISSLDINKKNPVPLSNSILGNYFILIYNVKEFNSRMKDKLDSMGFSCSWGWVNYYDEFKYQGELSIFRKPNKFKEQKEVRYIVNSAKKEPLVFEIGSLADIAIPFKIEDLSSLLLSNKKEKNFNVL